MSAFIVSPLHIATLVDYMAATKLVVFYDNTAFDARHAKTAQFLCDELARQNAESVNYRYKANHLPVSVKFHYGAAYNKSPVEILKACECYDYQSSETTDYDRTLAAKIVNLVRRAAIMSLPGYRNAAWEIA